MVKRTNKIQIPSARPEDQPATRKMLSLVRDELKSDIRALERKMDSRFNELKSEISGVRSEFSGLRSEFSGLRSEFSLLHSDNSRMAILLEEQNANNRIVLEGLQALWQRRDRLERRLG